MSRHNFDKPKAVQTFSNGISILQFFVVLAVVVITPCMQMQAHAHNAFAGCTCHISYVRRANCNGHRVVCMLFLVCSSVAGAAAADTN